ncbi:oxidoreductase [Vibrio metoecus]|uniref:oxidoreductase n=1 Tax=Vibrio metoecus TaxID=1481663 RepID=UPI000BA9191E|nr:oxidoreductase [Vibrio metoecus]PAR33412.1 oxidoreductase [Vibrio metoecus]
MQTGRTLFFTLLVLISNKLFAEEPILTLTHQDQTVSATYQELLARSDLTIVTETPWTQGNTEFKGISAQAILAWMGVKQADLKVIALNKYWAVIPYSDIEKYNPVFAIQKNGKPMAIRDRGPVWSIYPLSSSGELNNEVLHSRMVWQISHIEIISP